jgi:hypothetical protein
MTAIHPSPVSHSHDKYRKPIILDISDDPIITNTIPPQSGKIFPQRRPELTGILSGCNALFQKMQDITLGLSVYSGQLLLGISDKLNFPSQVPAPLPQVYKPVPGLF